MVARIDSVDLHQLGSGTFIWQRYDARVKAELFSTAVRTARGICLIDPIPLPNEMLAAALGGSEVVAVIVTNANHARAAVSFSTSFSVPVFAHAAVRPELSGRSVTDISEDTRVEDLRVLDVPGAAGGEIALLDESGAGTLVVGDALINFGSHGFSLLPSKYCENPKLLRKSLHRMLALKFDRMLFAHGTPILSGARARLAELLDGQ